MPGRLIGFHAGGRLGVVAEDGSGERFLDIDVPRQQRWQFGPSLPDGRLILHSFEDTTMARMVVGDVQVNLWFYDLHSGNLEPLHVADRPSSVLHLQRGVRRRALAAGQRHGRRHAAPVSDGHRRQRLPCAHAPGPGLPLRGRDQSRPDAHRLSRHRRQVEHVPQGLSLQHRGDRHRQRRSNHGGGADRAPVLRARVVGRGRPAGVSGLPFRRRSRPLRRRPVHRPCRRHRPPGGDRRASPTGSAPPTVPTATAAAGPT